MTESENISMEAQYIIDNLNLDIEKLQYRLDKKDKLLKMAKDKLSFYSDEDNYVDREDIVGGTDTHAIVRIISKINKDEGAKAKEALKQLEE